MNPMRHVCANVDRTVQESVEYTVRHDSTRTRWEGDGADAMPLGRLQDGCLRFNVLLGCHDGRVQASKTRLESSGEQAYHLTLRCAL